MFTKLRKRYPKSVRGRVVVLLTCALGLYLVDTVLLFPVWHASGVVPLRRVLTARGFPTLAAYASVFSLRLTEYFLAVLAGVFLGSLRGRRRWSTDAMILGVAYVILPFLVFYLTTGPAVRGLSMGLPFLLGSLSIPIVLGSAWIGSRLCNPPEPDREHCPVCGYPTRLLPTMRCPECGTDLEQHLMVSGDASQEHKSVTETG